MEDYNIIKMKIRVFKNPTKNKLTLTHTNNLKQKQNMPLQKSNDNNLLLFSKMLQQKDDQNCYKQIKYDPHRQSTIQLRHKLIRREQNKKSLPCFSNKKERSIQKINFSIEKHKKQRILQQQNKLKTVSTDEKYGQSQLIQNLFIQLKRSNVILSNHMKLYSIQKVQFQQLITDLAFFGLDNYKINANLSNFNHKFANGVTAALSKINTFRQQYNLMKKRRNLKITKYCDIGHYNEQIYRQEVREQTQQISTLIRLKQSNNHIIKQQQQKSNFYLDQINQNTVQLEHQLEAKINLQNQLNNLGHQRNQLIIEIDRHSSTLQTLKQTNDKITNFVSYQSNQILKLVSKDYKQIEADIYEYASYLQCNQLANDIDYEPAPFRAMEQLLFEQMRTLNKLIMQQQQVDVEYKNKLMRDFVLQSMDKFKKKDMEMNNLLQFKTKCINKFISNMKKWLSNWQLKQQYLVDLRNEFLIDSTEFNKRIRQMGQSGFCQKCNEKIMNEINNIYEIYKKIELNYKMGNYFY